MKTTAEQGSVDLQQCFKCLSPSTYILRPDVDSCQPCPLGLTCHGDATLEPTVAGSTWLQDGAIFRLTDCPTGFYLSPKSTETFNAAQQVCLACNKGNECTNTSCTTCTPCTAGYYKASISTEACLACPANTYREVPGATSLSFCVGCPVNAKTGGRTGQTILDNCVCDASMYSDDQRPYSCLTCPAGAVCSDRTCALARADLQCEKHMEQIKGFWQRISSDDGLFVLLGCPIGHRSEFNLL